MANTTSTEKRIAKMARTAAKAICALRRAGDLVGARKLEGAALEAAELMRAGRL